ncbi:MAG: dihydropteridine reductase [Clostridia bacterium]|nr:dihydropteridine reductase [Clostridia bacterium]
MNQETTFSYNYSAKENKELQDIRKKYLPCEENQLEKLKRLDITVQRPAKIFAYVFGSIGAVIMGAGMSLIMTEIGSYVGMSETMIPGMAIGVAGMLMAIINYPIYKKLLISRRTKHAEEILALSNSIMKD